jgi:acetyl-CoA synthetase
MNQFYFDYQPGEVFACTADIGWITGHSYVVYGPLCNGATTVTVLLDNTATHPNASK